MAEQFYTILTSIGKAKIANATALGNKVKIVKFQVGDGGGNYYNPTEEQTKLRNKVWEGNISSITVDENNPNWIVLETIIPGDIGGFSIREAGVFDIEGNLIAIGKYPETYKPVASQGSAKDLIIKMILEVSNTSSVTLKVDPTVILATKKDIEVLNNKIENIEVPVTSVNGQTGKVGLTSRDIPGLNNFSVEQSLLYTQEQLVILGKKQGKLATLKTTNKDNVVGALNELFTNASDGKYKVAKAITDKGINTLATDSFETLSDNIKNIKTGYSSGDIVPSQDLIMPGEEVNTLFNGSSTIKAIEIDKYENIYIGCGNGTVKKIDSNGKQIWIFNGHTDAITSIALDCYGNVYSGSNDYTVRKIDSNGKQIWKYNCYRTVISLVVNGNNIYVGTQRRTNYNNNLIKMNIITGVELWKFKDSLDCYNVCIAVDSEGYIYSSERGNILKIDPEGGKKIETKFLPDIGNNNTIYVMIIDKNNDLYTIGYEFVRKITNTGGVMWKVDKGIEGNLYCIGIDDLGYVYVGGNGGIKQITPQGKIGWKTMEHTIYGLKIDKKNNIVCGTFGDIKIISGNNVMIR